MIKKNLHIEYFFIIGFIIFIFSSCEKELKGDVFVAPSKIWANGIIKSNDVIKIYFGTTSGMNSGDQAGYRADATINLYVNNSVIPKKLVYKNVSENTGYYYYPRQDLAQPGDSLRFEGWVEGTDYGVVKAKTYIPVPVKIESINSVESFDSDKMKIELEIVLDTAGLQENSFFELQLKNNIFSKVNTGYKIPDKVENISVKNNLVLSYGMYWNENLKSILVDKSLIENNILKLSINIDDSYMHNSIEANLKTITPQYFDYFRAIENGQVVKSNISNGIGIFAGYSESIKTRIVK